MTRELTTKKLGKRRTAFLEFLVEHGRSTELDVSRGMRARDVKTGGDIVRAVAADLVDRGLAEYADPHLDRYSRLRPTWKPTVEGRRVLAGEGNGDA